MESLQQVFERAKKTYEKTKFDPPTEPHKSKYAAQGIFEDLKAILSGIYDAEQDEDDNSPFNSNDSDIVSSLH